MEFQRFKNLRIPLHYVFFFFFYFDVSDGNFMFYSSGIKLFSAATSFCVILIFCVKDLLFCLNFSRWNDVSHTSRIFCFKIVIFSQFYVCLSKRK